jgi:hypothetical protein
VRGITDLEQANEFLKSYYIAEFNSKFTVAAAQKGSAFVRARRKNLDWIFSAQHERTVHNDNTITLENRVFQLHKARWRDTLAGQTVVVHEHLDGRMSIRYGPHVIAQYASGELPPQAAKRRCTNRKEFLLNWRPCLQTSGIYRFWPGLLDRERTSAQVFKAYP